MEQITIQRDAPVRATDGELGRVKHVVVDPQTREVTEIVVGKGRKEWLIPINVVTGLDGDAVLLNGRRDQFTAAPAFRRSEFEGVGEERAEAERSDRALHGGAPLQSADEDAVVAGDGHGRDGTVRVPRPAVTAAAPGDFPPIPPVAPMDVSQAVPMVAAALDTSAAAPDAATSADTAVPAETLHLSDGAAQHLELSEERLRVEKEAVQAGVVRVRKVVREWTETVKVPLREERLVFEVMPGSGGVTIDGRPLEAGDTFEIALIEERASVIKETVVSEDVVVRKETVEVEETYEETLRREDLVVDGDGDLQVHDTEDYEADGAPAEEYETARMKP